MSDPGALDLWAKVKSCKLTDSQRHFAPDMARHFRDGDIARRLALINKRFPELAALMNNAGRGSTFSVNQFADLDAYMRGEELDELADKIAWGSAVRQVLSINVLSKKTTPRTVLDSLLNLVGYDLSSTGRKGPRDENGKQHRLYTVEDTTVALNPADVMRHLKAELQKSAEDVEAVLPIRNKHISASPPVQLIGPDGGARPWPG
jgi:NAD(P)-dependent dehydrogenase (short-subunit alcohol dehydrogenase family)